MVLSINIRINKMDFEHMEQIPATTGKSQPVFSITASGYARINKSFIKYNGLENVNFVELRGTKTMGKIEMGMKFLKDDDGNCLKISTDDRTGGKTFSLRSFFSHFGMYHKDIQKQKLKAVKQGAINGASVFVAEIKI